MSTDAVNVKCDQCGCTVNISLETEEVDRDSRQMGAEVQYDTTGEIDCACGNSISYIESEWEYPEGVPNTKEGPTVKGGTLIP